MLAAADRTDVPVARGRATPLSGGLAPVLAEAYRGARGREGRIRLPGPEAVSDTPAPDLIARTVHAHPGEVTVVAVGPQTNLAEALLADPTLADRIAGVVFMGGALGIDPDYGSGNITPFAECNIHFDAEAADVVLRSGVDVTMVGLDVTNPAKGMLLEEKVIESIEATTPTARLLADVCRTYLDAPMFDWGHGCVLYDPLAVAVAADPTLGVREDLRVRVDTAPGPEHGRTVRGTAADPIVHVLVDVDGEAVVRRVVETILSP